MKFTIDQWDPGYGTSESSELDVSTAELNLDIERGESEWRPIGPESAGALPENVWFTDGVRRVEARVWIEDGSNVSAGICASFAAGVVRCDANEAKVSEVIVRRGLFTTSPSAEAIATAHGTFATYRVSGSSPDLLSLALQEQMGNAEIEAAHASMNPGESGLLVIDGPLRGRQHLLHAVGLIKTHHTDYLPESLLPVLGALKPGERTPVFTIGGTWTRHSWYLRLPGPITSPRAGIVRCESSSDLSPDQLVEMANLTTRVLPKYASEAHKDSRAPQNLYPIAGLERVLRHRLGDATVMFRALRRSSGGH